MTVIARDPKRRDIISRKKFSVSNNGFVPVNEIPMDSRRKKDCLKGINKFPMDKHQTLQTITRMKEMLLSGDIRPAMDEVVKNGIDTFGASNVIALGILEYNKNLNLESMFPEIKTCSPKFLQKDNGGIILDRPQSLIYY